MQISPEKHCTCGISQTKVFSVLCKAIGITIPYQDKYVFTTKYKQTVQNL